MTENQEENESILYEVGYLIDTAFSGDSLSPEVLKIKEIINKYGGILSYEDSPKMKDLAYVLTKSFQGKYKKFQTAYFGYIRFNSERQSTESISQDIKKLNSIVRFILIKVEKEVAPLAPRFSHLSSDERQKVRKNTSPSFQESVGTMSNEEIDKTIEELVV